MLTTDFIQSVDMNNTGQMANKILFHRRIILNIVRNSTHTHYRLTIKILPPNIDQSNEVTLTKRLNCFNRQYSTKRYSHFVYQIDYKHNIVAFLYC